MDCQWPWITSGHGSQFHRGLVNFGYIYIKYISQSCLSSKLMPKPTKKKSHPSHWPEAARSASSEATATTLPNKDTKPGQKRGNPVPWQKDHGLTDSLLCLIEDKPVRLTICGFAGGSSKADGWDLIEHCQVMGDLLLICHESGWWASEDKQTARLAVKNWINWLKKNYMHY